MREQPVLPPLDGLSAVMIDEAVLLREPLLQKFWQAIGWLSPRLLKQSLGSPERLDFIQASKLRLSWNQARNQHTTDSCVMSSEDARKGQCS